MTTMGKFCMYWLDPSGIMATRYSVGRGGLRVSRDDNSNDNYDNDNGDSLPSPYSLLLPSSLSSSSSTSTSEEEEEVINSANNFPSPGGVKNSNRLGGGIGFGLDDGGGRNICRRLSFLNNKGGKCFSPPIVQSESNSSTQSIAILTPPGEGKLLALLITSSSSSDVDVDDEDDDDNGNSEEYGDGRESPLSLS